MKECPKCKAKEYNNRSMIMMISECGHPLCKNCVDNLFARNSGRCPQCNKMLLKKSFWVQVFDDPWIEKENHIRKRLKKIYNLKRDDFATLRDYNDYLEKFEIIVFNLANDIDIRETELEVQQFKEQNEEIISRNRRKLDEDELWIAAILDEERRKKACAQDTLENEIHESSTEQNAKEIINELKLSNLPAEVILDRKRKRKIEEELAEKERAAGERRKKARLEASRRIETATFAPIKIEGGPFEYKPIVLTLNGPPLPTMNSIKSMGYLQHVRTFDSTWNAGGFLPELCCMRALFDSRVDLFAV